MDVSIGHHMFYMSCGHSLTLRTKTSIHEVKYVSHILMTLKSCPPLLKQTQWVVPHELSTVITYNSKWPMHYGYVCQVTI